MRKEPFRTLILMGIVITAVFTFKMTLIAILKTEYPLQTPISSSMEPTLHIGDLLIVQGGVDAKDIIAKPITGDIIVFRRPGKPEEFVVHRAIGKFKRGGRYYFTTKGDNNPVPDSWIVPEENIIGKVIWVIPYLGYVKIYLGTSWGIATIIILLGVIVIVETLPTIKNDEKRKIIKFFHRLDRNNSSLVLGADDFEGLRYVFIRFIRNPYS